MRTQYPGWYPKSAGEVAALWDTAIFVPDANVLLHCLRHPEQVRRELLRVFEALRESLWIPYQVGLEFHRNRLDVELGAQDAYEALIRDQDAVFEKARERLRQLRAHPVISVESELAQLEGFQTSFKERMQAARLTHPTSAIGEAVDRLTDLLADRIGEKWPSEKMVALKKEGEDRYARKVPPGYRDAKKDSGEFDKFGDLIIWRDMIAKAKEAERPVIFVTDDAKEDWWWIHRGRKLGPRPELVEEFQAGSGQSFHLYEFAQFLRFAAERHPEIKPAVERVEKSLADDERARRRHDQAAEVDNKLRSIRRLEEERDQVVFRLAGSPGAAPEPVVDRSALRTRLTDIDEQLAALAREVEQERSSTGPNSGSASE